jgi:flagellar operon protein
MSPIKMNNEYMHKRVKINPTDSTPIQQRQNLNSQNSFGEVLNKIREKDGVKFSKHAMDRLNSRKIELTESEVSRINEGVGKAKSKGVREALIMMDNKVFVASVQNNTIITAVTEDQLKDNVFTNIDGAVIV